MQPFSTQLPSSRRDECESTVPALMFNRKSAAVRWQVGTRCWVFAATAFAVGASGVLVGHAMAEDSASASNSAGDSRRDASRRSVYAW